MATVVIIDDDPSARALLREFVQRSAPDLQVAGEAADGKAGVRLAGELKPDAVVLDWHMPVMDGLAALPMLRDATPDSAVVMFSSAGRAEAVRAEAAGVDAYVDKGDGPGAVIAALRAALERR